jgi:phytoene/squalene synthetase
VYLPAQDIEKFGCTMTPGGAGKDGQMTGDLAELIRFEAQRARQWYSRGLQLMPLLDRRSAACTGAMAGIYLRLLDHICAAPQEAISRRMSLPAGEKALVAAAALAGMTTRAGISGRGALAGAASQPGGQA